MVRLLLRTVDSVAKRVVREPESALRSPSRNAAGPASTEVEEREGRREERHTVACLPSPIPLLLFPAVTPRSRRRYRLQWPDKRIIACSISITKATPRLFDCPMKTPQKCRSNDGRRARLTSGFTQPLTPGSSRSGKREVPNHCRERRIPGILSDSPSQYPCEAGEVNIAGAVMRAGGLNPPDRAD